MAENKSRQGEPPAEKSDRRRFVEDGSGLQVYRPGQGRLDTSGTTSPPPKKEKR